MKITVLGSGTWGTALSQVLADNGNDVTIYGYKQEQIDEINNKHTNRFYFDNPDIHLSEKIKGTTDLKLAVKDADYIVVSIPTIAIREVLEKVNTYLTKPAIFINTAKGFDPLKKIRISELIRELISKENLLGLVSLIGPSHAEEVIVKDLTCICAVSLDEKLALKIAELFSNDYFRVYVNTDEIGSEISVAMKNAIAIASGILEGLGYGANARAALCSRGLAEMVRFGTFFGGKPETFLGLTGVGDLAVTCYSFYSRNFTAGHEIGKADDASMFLRKNTKTVEGIRTIEVIYHIAKENNIELPVISSLYDVIYKNSKPSIITRQLMLRPIKKEF